MLPERDRRLERFDEARLARNPSFGTDEFPLPGGGAARRAP
jgi:hypothetical protein